MLGIITAMQIESELLASSMTDTVYEKAGKLDVIRGKLGKSEVVLATCGIGKVAAAVTVQSMIMKYSPSAIINSGCAGSLSSKLKIGDIAIADRAVEHDMDTSPLGDPLGFISGINLIYIPCDRQLAERIAGIADELGKRSLIGTAASGDRFVADRESKREIGERFDALVCDMESASVVHTAYLSDVPCTVIRSVSDSFEGDAAVDYMTFVKLAADESARLLIAFCERYEY